VFKLRRKAESNACDVRLKFADFGINHNRPARWNCEAAVTLGCIDASLFCRATAACTP